MIEPTADEIMEMFAADIAVLRRGRRKPVKQTMTKKQTAKPLKKPSNLTPEQIARKREATRQWRLKHKEQVLEYNRRYKLAHRPKFHHLSREEQEAYRRNYELLHPEAQARKNERRRERRRLAKQENI